MKKLYNKKTHTDFIDKANQVHNSTYEYLSQYLNASTKIKIQHKQCGTVFFQRPNNHTSLKQGCPVCGRQNQVHALTKSHEKFVEQCQQIHNKEYVYLEQYTKDAAKIKIRHNVCGHVFYQRASSHIQGQGCPECSSSKGERLIKHWLEENNVSFMYQHKFDNCVNPFTRRKLKFDFFLPRYNVAIEFDGLQHYRPVRFIGMSAEQAEKAFELCNKLDKIKNDFCKQNKIELIRIGIIQNKLDNNEIDQILLDVIS